VPEVLPFGEAELKPLAGGETLAWRLVAAGAGSGA
jgi:dihydroorotase